MSKIKNVRIEPASNGGFVVEVMEASEGEEICCPKCETSVFGSVEAMTAFVAGLFPSSGFNQKKGKLSSHEAGGSKVDTYEG